MPRAAELLCEIQLLIDDQRMVSKFTGGRPNGRSLILRYTGELELKGSWVLWIDSRGVEFLLSNSFSNDAVMKFYVGFCL